MNSKLASAVFNVSLATLAMLALAIPFFVLALVIKVESHGPIFFRQVRVGHHGRLFRIYKFRTMRTDDVGIDPIFEDSKRITAVGRFLRRTKIDELPQIINVVKREMNLVGPRPEVAEFVEMYSEKNKQIVLSVLPGMTDFASIRYRNEEQLLAAQRDPMRYYKEHVMPAKLRYWRFYVRHASMSLDIHIILQTLATLFFGTSFPATASGNPTTTRGTVIFRR